MPDSYYIFLKYFIYGYPLLYKNYVRLYIMEHSPFCEINDARSPAEFRGISFSKYKKQQ